MQNNTIFVTNYNSTALATNTDFLRKAKDVAIVFLEIPIETRTIMHSDGKAIKHIVHPFLNDRIVYFEDDTEHPFHDILNDDAALQKAVLRYRNFIEKSGSIDEILLLITKPYRLQFLDIIQKGLSPDEMGRLLAGVWVGNECPNNDVIPLSTIIKWFKNASKQSLMYADEFAYYDSLPDEFTVYRGIGSESNKKGISYTLSLEKAEWFANRFQKKGYVLTGTAKKKDVIAYFNRREEQEILIEPKKIASLHKM